MPEGLQALTIYESTSQENSVRLLAVGDIGFSGRIREKYDKSGNYEEIFSDVRPFLNSGDLFFGNLETQFIKNAKPLTLFAADPDALSSLKAIGINLLHLANNHALDYGLSGLSYTIEQLKFNCIIPLGIGETKDQAKKLVITDVKGIHIGWLACGHTLIDQKGGGPYFWEFDEKELLDEVRNAKSQVDVLIVSIHTGLMYLDYPKPELKSYTEKLFDSGVNLILMHHAHVLQSVQIKQDGSICCYNLGNFIFDWQEGNVIISILEKEQNESAVFVFDIGKEGIVNAIAIPTFIDEHYSVRWAVGKRGEHILTRLIKISKDIQSNYSMLFNKQRVDRNSSPIYKVLTFHLREKNWKYIWELFKHIRFEHFKILFEYIFHYIFKKNEDNEKQA